jgi:hypothetical protein
MGLRNLLVASCFSVFGTTCVSVPDIRPLIQPKFLEEVVLCPEISVDEMEPVDFDLKEQARVDDIPLEIAVKVKYLAIVESDYRNIIKRISTPVEAAAYCTEVLSHGGNDIDQEVYGFSDYSASFRVIHERAHKNNGVTKDDCDGGALAAAALLSDDGFKPYILYIDGKTIGHVVFVYKNMDGKFGSIGINKEDVHPANESIDSLVKKIFKPVDATFTKYDIFDISIKFPDYIYNDKNNDLVVVK